MSEPLVSVAIVTYNHELFIEDTVRSVITQDYSNIEIIIGDDASTDSSPEKLERLKIAYPQIKLILGNENMGITENFNRVLSACSGKYVAWMGGDDLMLPTKLRKQVEFMESHDECNICFHNMEVFESESGRILFLYNAVNHPKDGEIDILIKYGTFNQASSNLTRRSSHPPYGFDVRIPVASDWLFWIECLSKGGKICYIDEVLGRYRKHSKGVTNLNSAGYFQAKLDHLNTCNILLFKFPKYTSQICYRLSRIYRNLAILYKEQERGFLLLSLKTRFNIKVLVRFLLTFFNLT